MRRVLPPLLLALAGSAPSPPPPLHYVAYSAGLRVLDVQFAFDIGPGSYTVASSVHTVGVLAAFVSGQAHSHVAGDWREQGAAPRHYESAGMWRGHTVRTVMDYDLGTPHAHDLLPDPDPDPREPVPASALPGAIDALSALATTVRQVARTGGCDGHVRLFDGRRLSDVSARTVGTETLPPTSRSSFQGPALRCDFEGTLLAGFTVEGDRAEQARPHRGTAWFAAVRPDSPKLPVRVTFDNRSFGSATMYLDQ